jgi:hypothetical protein
MLRSAVLIRRAVMMPRTYELSFLVAFNGPFVPPIKDACDEQPNDRQWQSEDDKCHRSADKHCKHTHPPTSFAALQTRGLSSEKRAGGRIYPAAPQQVEKARRPLGLAALELNDC